LAAFVIRYLYSKTYARRGPTSGCSSHRLPLRDRIGSQTTRKPVHSAKAGFQRAGRGRPPLRNSHRPHRTGPMCSARAGPPLPRIKRGAGPCCVIATVPEVHGNGCTSRGRAQPKLLKEQGRAVLLLGGRSPLRNCTGSHDYWEPVHSARASLGLRFANLSAPKLHGSRYAPRGQAFLLSIKIGKGRNTL
jgi:hypothetical protein